MASGIQVASCAKTSPTRSALPPSVGTIQRGCSELDDWRLKTRSFVPSRETSTGAVDTNSRGSDNLSTSPVVVEMLASCGLPSTRTEVMTRFPTAINEGRLSGLGGPGEMALSKVSCSRRGGEIFPRLHSATAKDKSKKTRAIAATASIIARREIGLLVSFGVSVSCMVTASFAGRAVGRRAMGCVCTAAAGCGGPVAVKISATAVEREGGSGGSGRGRTGAMKR